MSDSAVESELGRYVLRDASLLVFITDTDGTILEANSYAESLCGMQLGGVSITEVMVNSPGSFSLESAHNQEGPHLWSVSTASGLPQTFSFHLIDQGSQVIFIGEHNHRDSNLLETRLVQLNQEVSNSNRELQKKSAELARLNEMKNRLIGTAAHDLRNPIGAIHHLSADLSQDTATLRSDEEAEILSLIHDSSGFMLSLIDDLLSVATLESSVMQLNREPTDLNRIVATCMKLNQPAADRKSVVIELKNTAAFPEVDLDRMKIQQVLNNLISNAVKFSPHGSTVVVTVAADNANAVVSVEDQGPGVPQAELGKLFKPFSRTSVQPTDGEKSTGLGLFIVKQIVEAHGGTISVDTEVGTGAAFRFSLPLSELSATSEARS